LLIRLEDWILNQEKGAKTSESARQPQLNLHIARTDLHMQRVSHLPERNLPSEWSNIVKARAC